jgi:U4/U6 small nuclear ribonucleoprotein PRP3
MQKYLEEEGKKRKNTESLHPSISIGKDGNLELTTAYFTSKKEFTSKANSRLIEELEKKNPSHHNPYLTKNSTKIHHQRVLKFNEEGKFIKEGNEIRLKEKMAKLKSKISTAVRKVGLTDELELVGENAIVRDPIPDYEWWDAPFINEGERVLNDLIQHPALSKGKGESITRPLMLTQREIKKARRIRRQERLREMNEKIRLGILPPALPKVNVANFMRIMGDDAVQEPTAIEISVQKQVQKRLEEHLKRNAENKLSVEEKRYKKDQKLREDLTEKVHVAVFKVKDVSNPLHKNKLVLNAQQYKLSGICICPEGKHCIVIIEGGIKGVAKYINLLMKRMDWTIPSTTSSSQVPLDNTCELLWEGVVPEKNFHGFKIRKCCNELEIKQLLNQKVDMYFSFFKQ